MYSNYAKQNWHITSFNLQNSPMKYLPFTKNILPMSLFILQQLCQKITQAWAPAAQAPTRQVSQSGLLHIGEPHFSGTQGPFSLAFYFWWFSSCISGSYFGSLSTEYTQCTLILWQESCPWLVYNNANSMLGNTVDWLFQFSMVTFVGCSFLNSIYSFDVCIFTFIVQSHALGQRSILMFSKRPGENTARTSSHSHVSYLDKVLDDGRPGQRDYLNVFKLHTHLNLKERKRKEFLLYPILWFIPRIPTIARAGSDWSLGSRLPNPALLHGVPHSDPSSAAFQGLHLQVAGGKSLNPGTLIWNRGIQVES